MSPNLSFKLSLRNSTMFFFKASVIFSYNLCWHMLMVMVACICYLVILVAQPWFFGRWIDVSKTQISTLNGRINDWNELFFFLCYEQDGWGWSSGDDLWQNDSEWQNVTSTQHWICWVWRSRQGVNFTNILRAAFFVRKFLAKLYCPYILGLNFFKRRNIDTNVLIICW